MERRWPVKLTDSRGPSLTVLPEEPRMKVSFFSEPMLRFGYGQEVEDPRDGLMLFGPLDEGHPYGIRSGVVGTPVGIEYFKRWLRRVQGPLTDARSEIARPPFPGFESVFRIQWAKDPVLALEVAHEALIGTLFLDDRHQRVYQVVNLYADKIVESLRSEDSEVDVWFVVIPDDVYLYCRPRSRVPAGLQIEAPRRMSPTTGRRLQREPSLFEEDNILAVAYHYDVDFHHQLKARLLQHLAPTQIVRESTIAPPEGLPGVQQPRRDMSGFHAAIAWNLSTAAFYKAGGRPWKIGGIRDGVCYIGLVFKQDVKQENPRAACCAAQMFLDSGDGVVFRGAVGPWYSPKTGEFHLSRRAARDLIAVALESYKAKTSGSPKELFIHGKVWFSDEEWAGFADAVDPQATRLVGIRIREGSSFRLYREGTHPVLRGIAYGRNPRSAYLWTRGYTPRLRTYVGREVPRPLRIDVARGEADLRLVLSDIMALTKLNYNACMFSDGVPVTLRFANAVGEILTAGPVGTNNPLPFKYYI